MISLIHGIQKAKLIEQKVEWLLPGAGLGSEGRNGKVLVKRYDLPVIS